MDLYSKINITRADCSLILLVSCCMLYTCTKTERIACDYTDGSRAYFMYVKKTKDDKTLVGVERNVTNEQGTTTTLYVPIIYDHITVLERWPNMFIGTKDGTDYILKLNQGNSVILDKVPYNGIEGDAYDLRRNFGVVYGQVYTIKSDDKRYIYLRYKKSRDAIVSGEVLGPFEDFYAAVEGYMYKENGKWGYVPKRMRFIPGHANWVYRPLQKAVPPVYDAIIEIDNSIYYPSTDPRPRNPVYLLVLKDNTWSVLDYQQNPVTVSQSAIKTLLGVPIRKYFIRRYDRLTDNALPCGDIVHKRQRIGNKDTGIILTFNMPWWADGSSEIIWMTLPVVKDAAIVAWIPQGES